MTEEVRILRERLKEIEHGETAGLEGVHDGPIELTRIQLMDIAGEALEQADAVKNAPIKDIPREDLEKSITHDGARPTTVRPAPGSNLPETRKDGPSENDKERVLLHEGIHEREVTQPHNCEFCWIISELKKYMGIE